jgi:hypothetical protein
MCPTSAPGGNLVDGVPPAPSFWSEYACWNDRNDGTGKMFYHIEIQKNCTYELWHIEMAEKADMLSEVNVSCRMPEK